MLITAPITSRSGYGEHARDLVRSLMSSDKYDIKYARDNQIKIADIDKTNESYLKGQRIFVDMNLDRL